MNPQDMLDPSKVLLTEADFDAFVSAEVAMLKTRMEEKPEDLMPYLTVKTVDANGNQSLTLCAIAMPFNESDEKRNALMGLGAKFYKEMKLPLAISLTCEAWMARNLADDVMPRNSPDKKEVAIVIAMDLTSKLNRIVCLPIKRDDKNRMEITDDEPVGIDERPDAKNVRSPLLSHFFRGFALCVVKDALNEGAASDETPASDSGDPAHQ